jgi:2-polyprenyl-6-hydroxyphenyl methylase/3-demethylubiquinone-9 3-methyltransferase
VRTRGPRRARNDPLQYDDLAEEWWKRRGAFAALHWLARSRAALIPRSRRDALLVDIGCGAGLLAPHVNGYRHIGVDLVPSALQLARQHGVLPVRADAAALPLADGCADVVVAGEVFEHVSDLPSVVAECARILRPGGLIVADTIASGRRARVEMIILGERLPGGPPPRIHDPDLFVGPRRLAELFEQHGVRLRFRGVRPSVPGYLWFLVGRGSNVRMVPVRGLRSLYQAMGRKAS